MADENKNIKMLDDNDLESVYGGNGSQMVANRPYEVTETAGAFVYSDTEKSSSHLGTHPFGSIIFVTGFPYTGKDHYQWVKVPAQKNVSLGYVRLDDLTPSRVTVTEDRI